MEAHWQRGLKHLDTCNDNVVFVVWRAGSKNPFTLESPLSSCHQCGCLEIDNPQLLRVLKHAEKSRPQQHQKYWLESKGGQQSVSMIAQLVQAHQHQKQVNCALQAEQQRARSEMQLMRSQGTSVPIDL